MLVLHILLAALGFPALAFLFGWWLLSRCTNLDHAERFAAAPAVTIVLAALAEFVAFLTGADQTLCNGGIVFALLLIVGARAWRTSERVAGDWYLPVFWSLGYLHFLLVQALLPIYAGSHWYYDWYMHYATAQVFRGNIEVHASWAGYSLASRTPIFNLTAAAVQSLAGDEFFIFQIAATFLNYCFVAPLYLVLRDLTGARAARLALVLVPLNLWMLHIAWFTWSKMLTAYFLFLGLHFYLRFVQLREHEPARAWRCFLAFWTCALIGVMTHQVALVYLAALLAHALWLAFRERRAIWFSVPHILVLTVVSIVVIAPWYGWLLCEFGLQEIMGRTPVTLMDDEPNPPGWFLVSFAANLGASVVPVRLIEVIVYGPHSWEAFYDALTQIYFSLLTGALTLSLSAWLLLRGVHRLWQDGWPALHFRWTDEACALTLFVIFGITLGTLLHPLIIPWGVAHAALFPAVVLLAGLAWMRLARAPGRWPWIVAGGMMLEFFGMFWSHVWLAIEDPSVLDPSLANLGYKVKYQCVFLHDVGGPHEGLFASAALILQLLCVFFLTMWLRRQANDAQEGKDLREVV